MRKALLLILLLVASPASAQIAIPNTFTTRTTASSDDINQNFATLGAQALNRTGGTLTGNLAANAGVTIDGVDVGATVCAACSPTFTNLTLTGTLTVAGLSSFGSDDGKIRTDNTAVFTFQGGANGFIWRNNANTVTLFALTDAGPAVFSSTVSVQSAVIQAGTGAPEGVVTGAVGDIFIRRDGGAGTVLCVKESGAGNTGWVCK